LGREWERIVEEEFEQVESVREWQDEDHYGPIAHHFTEDPQRTDDEILNRLREIGDHDTIWLDVGAGGGRYALPLALSSKRVIAVEPSEGMRDVLRSQAAEHGIDNLEIRDYRWPEGSDAVHADISLNSHVGYDIRPINAFIDGLERASSQLCVALMMDRAPSGGFVRLWERVHGFKRQQLPAMREFVALLLARGATPEIELFPRSFRPKDDEELLTSARRRLWLVEGSEKDRKLQQILAEERAGIDNYEQPTAIAMIRWQPMTRSWRVSRTLLAEHDERREVHDGNAGGDAAEGRPVDQRAVAPPAPAADQPGNLDDYLRQRADTDCQEDRRPERRVDETADPDPQDGRGAGQRRQPGEVRQRRALPEDRRGDTDALGDVV
jgi:hypothetical protein